MHSKEESTDDSTAAAVSPVSLLPHLISRSSVYALQSLTKCLRIISAELYFDSAKDSTNSEMFSARIRWEFASFRDRVDQIKFLQTLDQTSLRCAPADIGGEDLIGDLESLQLVGTHLTSVLDDNEPSVAFDLAVNVIQDANDRIEKLLQSKSIQLQK